MTVKIPFQGTCAVFIDSLFLKQTIRQVKEVYPKIEESDISLTAIMNEIIGYTGFANYHVFYFEIPANHLKPAINLAVMGKTIKTNGKAVKFRLVEANLIAPELSEFFIENRHKYENSVLVADDLIYSGMICGNEEYPNLTVFRKREPDTRMTWDFCGRYAYFEDVILEICKNTR